MPAFATLDFEPARGQRLDSEQGRRRHVFFLSGFDPKGPGFYHRLYREGAETRNRLGGEPMHVSPRQRLGTLVSGWDVDFEVNDGAHRRVLRTCFEFMRWDDIVRRHWPRGPWPQFRDYWNVYVDAVRLGVFVKIRRASPAAWGLALFPGALALIFGIFWLLTIGIVLWWLQPGRPTTTWVISFAAVPVGLWLWRWLETVSDSQWLLRLYAFAHQQSLDRTPALEERLDWQARRVAEVARQDPGCEILIVGYSTGSMMAASVASRAIDLIPELGSRERGLSLLTLGHCVPVLSSCPGAVRFRQELDKLADTLGLNWLDQSAPADWAAFASTPPWPPYGSARRLQRSPAFHKQMSPAAYTALKRDKRALHLQYLKSPGKLGSYDYFALTAGPLSLSQQIDRLSANGPHQ